jgi:AcrR family transcriptional regulator
MLAAARRVFAREGLDAPLEAIAREAGVARATQHRHFPTRESLIRAIFDDNLDELARIAAEAPDPAEAYVATLLATVGMMARDRGFVDLFNHRDVGDDIKQEIGARFLAIVAEPLAAAQAAGRVRDDLELEDTILLVDMLGAAVGLTGRERPDRRTERAIALVLDAITPPAGSPRP